MISAHLSFFGLAITCNIQKHLNPGLILVGPFGYLELAEYFFFLRMVIIAHGRFLRKGFLPFSAFRLPMTRENLYRKGNFTVIFYEHKAVNSFIYIVIFTLALQSARVIRA